MSRMRSQDQSREFQVESMPSKPKSQNQSKKNQNKVKGSIFKARTKVDKFLKTRTKVVKFLQTRDHFCQEWKNTSKEEIKNKEAGIKVAIC